MKLGTSRSICSITSTSCAECEDATKTRDPLILPRRGLTNQLRAKVRRAVRASPSPWEEEVPAYRFYSGGLRQP